MGTYIRPVKYRELLENSPRRVFVNDLSELTLSDRLRNDELIGHRLIGDTLDDIPACQCGRLKGRCFFTSKIKCTHCGEIPSDPLQGKVHHELWLRKPENCQPFIRVAIYSMLRQALMAAVSQRLDVLAWITNPVYTPPGKGKRPQGTIDIINSIVAECGGQRGWNQFILNFDKYLELFKKTLFEPGKKGVEDLYNLIESSRADGTLFSDVLPLPSRHVIVQEHTASNADTPRIYIDPVHSRLMDVVKTAIGLDSSSSAFSDRMKERRIASIMQNLAETIEQYFEEFLGGKPGYFRRLFSGWRGDFTGRAVISAITEEHEPDEIILPWRMFIKIYEYHISSKLLARDYTLAQLLQFFQCIYRPVLSNPTHKRFYDEANQIIDELIQESPEGLIPFYSNRNPTLDEGSCQLFNVVNVDRDPNGMASGHPAMNVVRMNADYDGDALQYMAMLYVQMARLFSGMRPHLLALDRTKPHAASNSFRLTAPAAINASRADYVTSIGNKVAYIPEMAELLERFQRILD